MEKKRKGSKMFKDEEENEKGVVGRKGWRERGVNFGLPLMRTAP
jgi:hypothetical protein